MFILKGKDELGIAYWDGLMKLMQHSFTINSTKKK